MIAEPIVERTLDAKTYPKLKTVDLNGITHINENGLGCENAKKYGFVSPFYPNNIDTIINTNDLVSVDQTALDGTRYYANLFKAHKNDTSFFPVVLGSVLLKGLATKNQTGHLDFSKYPSLNNVKYFSLSLSDYKYTGYTLPKNFIKYTGPLNSRYSFINLNKVSSLQYYNGATTPVELKTTIINSAINGKKLNDKDIAFIKNNFIYMTGSENTDSSLAANSGYLYDIPSPIQSMASLIQSNIELASFSWNVRQPIQI